MFLGHSVALSNYNLKQKADHCAMQTAD